MKRFLLTASLLVLVLMLGACSEAIETTSSGATGEAVGTVVPVEGGGHYTDIIPQELRAMLDSQDVFLVNVHIPYEGELEQTDAFIPFDAVEARLDEFPEDLDATIVLYCRSGSMSASSAPTLVKAGYTNVYNLDGGFRGWEAAGYTLIQK